MNWWTVERVNKLTKLWEGDDYSASEIGEILGTTRNAVIGKANRICLKPRKEGVGPKRYLSLKARAKAKKREYDRVRYLAEKHPPKMEIVAVKPEPQVPEFEVDLAALKTPAWQPLEGSIPIPLHMTNEHTCKWPVSEDAPYMFCGCHTVEGSSWCAVHKARSISLGTVAERAAHRVKAKQLEAA